MYIVVILCGNCVQSKSLAGAKMNLKRLFALILLVGLVNFSLKAQTAQFNSETDVKVEQFVSSANLEAGSAFDLAVVFTVPTGFHITDSDLFYVKTDSAANFKFSAAEYSGKIKYKEIFVYRDTVKVLLKGTYPTANLTNGKLVVGYQICSEVGDESCFMPVEKVLDIDLSKVKPELFSKLQVKPEILNKSENIESKTEEDAIADKIKTLKKWSLWIFILAFFGGILDSFTPCVYPVIPIVISYMGARSTGKKKAGFILSLFFVFGLAITYSIVGTVVAFLGGIIGIGDIAYNPWVLGTIATIFIALSTSMFGFWDMNFVSSDKKSKWMQRDFSGVGGAVLLGMISGVIAAPCVGPVLAALLIHVATEGDVLYGWLLLLCFAFGLGLLFLVIGTFSGAINALPKAGVWMVNIKKFFGIMMVGAAIYFLHFLFPAWLTYGIIGFMLTLLAVFMGGYKKIDEESNILDYFGKALGIVLTIAGAVYILISLGNFITLPFGNNQIIDQNASKNEEVNFIIAKEDTLIVTNAFTKAAAENKIVMMDFWATWCPNCIELDKTVWNQTDVKDLAEQKFIAVKVDLTENDDFAVWAKMKYKDYGANNPPLILFLQPDGTVIAESRGLVSREIMLERMRKALE